MNKTRWLPVDYRKEIGKIEKNRDQEANDESKDMSTASTNLHLYLMMETRLISETYYELNKTKKIDYPGKNTATSSVMKQRSSLAGAEFLACREVVVYIHNTILIRYCSTDCYLDYTSVPKSKFDLKECNMADRDRLLELLQSEPSWHGDHLFAENLRWMAYMGAHTGPNPRHLSFVQMAMRTVLGALHALGYRNVIVCFATDFGSIIMAYSLAVFVTSFSKTTLVMCALLEELSGTLGRIGHDQGPEEEDVTFHERMKRELADAIRRHQMLLERTPWVRQHMTAAGPMEASPSSALSC
ncbi:Protein of unknown function [Gryllus bimaculatus]|nr:Protein of unknown function [Gryllus bimaculatus]